MKKNFNLLFLVVAFFGLSFINVQAVSIGSQDLGGSECSHTNPVDTITCASFYTVTTYTTPSPEGPVQIDVTHELNDNGGTAAIGMLTCGGGGAGSCTSTDVSSDVKGQTGGMGGPVTVWGNIPRGVGGSVTPTLTADSYEIALHHYVSGASGLQDCIWTGGSCSIMPENETTTGGILVVEAPAGSVLLEITSYLEKAVAQILALVGRVNYAYAQTGVVNATSTKKPSTSIVIANINLTNPQLLKISENNYYVSFTLTNKGETQSDVYYAFSFIDEKEKIVSTQTFNKSITLEKNAPFFVTEKVNTPKGLDGTYTVRVQAYTQTGLPLGFGTAGQIVLTGTTMPSLDSCSLLKNTYEVNQILNINCTIKNITQGSAEYIVSSKIFYGSEPHQRQSVSAEVVNSKATTKISSLTIPGIYTIRTGLYERNGTPVGKEISEQFTVKGTSISILNLLLDKNSYTRGEQAKVTASFGLFSTTPLTQLKINATITGKQGVCADVYTTPLERRRAVELMIPITTVCKNPFLVVQVLDETNKVLAEKSMGLVTKNGPLDFKAKVGYGVALAILLMATFSLLRRAKKHGAASIVRKIVKKK